jgi:ElaB/YqjD/DUF883 family membrane-anchored ribosome-binding protein
MAAPADQDFGEHIEKIRADIAALRETMAQLVSDTAGIQASLKRRVDAAAQRAVRAGEELVDEAGALGDEAMRAAARTAGAAVGDLEARIARNPLSSVLIALGLGFAVGILGRR